MHAKVAARGNRLYLETSPYLLQHAHDPVDWYAWGREALAQARQFDRPIFLSVGYSACHWCHVMHQESFTDTGTAEALNAGFVSIKVDREERPDIDALYMDAVQSLTGSGGWPMSVFLTPDGRPFFGGTYFPSAPRHGLASFRQVLEAIRDAWTERRDEVEASASRLAEAIAQGQRTPVRNEIPSQQAAEALVGTLASATASLLASFDTRTGGWGGAPKFPQPMVIEYLLREHVRTGQREPLDVAVRGLDAMAAGGIRDHLAGGFARYATDDIWLVPHFEKMLYDNAQLALVYLHAWQVTGHMRHAAVAVETLAFLERDLLVIGADGGVGFAASLDADTDGHEGQTYVWTRDDIDDILGADAPLFTAAYGVTRDGNWEARNILSRVLDDAALAAVFSISRDDAAVRLAGARKRLLDARDRRPQPARDEKVLASWNGLALAVFAEAGRTLPDGARYSAIATGVAESLQRLLWTAEGRLCRSWKDGQQGASAVLEDHVHLAAGLLALYQTTFDGRWFEWAAELMQVAMDHFADPRGGFHDTADDAEGLFARPRSLVDSPLPSGNSMAVTVLAQLAALTGDALYRDTAERAVQGALDVAVRHPTAFAHWLIGIGLLLEPIDEIAIVGDAADPALLGLIAATRAGYHPWQVIACAHDTTDSPVPLLRGRLRRDGRATAYVCRGFACQLPVTTPAALSAQLGSRGRP